MRAEQDVDDEKKTHASEWFYGDIMTLIKALQVVSLDDDGTSLGRLHFFGEETFTGRAQFAKEYFLRSRKQKWVSAMTQGDNAVRKMIGPPTRSSVKHNDKHHD